jgi:Zn-dependent protease with chaperone function
MPCLLLGHTPAAQRLPQGMARKLCYFVIVRFHAGIAFAILLVGGCDLAATKRAWVAGKGGELARDPQLSQVQTIAAKVSAGSSTLTFHILASDDPRAYSWPDGSIYVTRGLINLLNDDELAAVIAHERGHLVKSGATTSVVSLRGCDKDLAVEMHADAVGVQLLKDSGIPATTMADMLRKVRDGAHITPECRKGMEERIAAVSTAASQ